MATLRATCRNIQKISSLLTRYVCVLIINATVNTDSTDQLVSSQWTRSTFYVLLTVHLGIIFANKRTWCTNFSYMSISILYMFRAAMCPSSGELIVPMQHLVYVTRCRWPSGMQVGMKFWLAYQMVICTEWHIPGVALVQLMLLMMGTCLPETCREYKQTYKKKSCIKLVYLQRRSTFSVDQMKVSGQRLIVLETLHFLNILPFDASRPKDGLLSATLSVLK